MKGWAKRAIAFAARFAGGGEGSDALLLLLDMSNVASGYNATALLEWAREEVASDSTPWRMSGERMKARVSHGASSSNVSNSMETA